LVGWARSALIGIGQNTRDQTRGMLHKIATGVNLFPFPGNDGLNGMPVLLALFAYPTLDSDYCHA
jgi:hypothetical protein